MYSAIYKIPDFSPDLNFEAKYITALMAVFQVRLSIVKGNSILLVKTLSFNGNVRLIGSALSF